DKEMLDNVMAYQPASSDILGSQYRELIVKGFYVKAQVEYGLGDEMAAFYDEALTPLDPGFERPNGLGIRNIFTNLSDYHQANALRLSDFELVATLDMSSQEKNFFNAHLQGVKSIDNRTTDESGSPILTFDYRNRWIVPTFNGSTGIWSADVVIDEKRVVMELNKGTREFTKTIYESASSESNSILKIEKYIPGINIEDLDVFDNRKYTKTVTDAAGSILDTQVIPKTDTPSLFESNQFLTIKGILDQDGPFVPPVDSDEGRALRDEIDRLINRYESGTIASPLVTLNETDDSLVLTDPHDSNIRHVLSAEDLPNGETRYIHTVLNGNDVVAVHTATSTFSSGNVNLNFEGDIEGKMVKLLYVPD
ncbi:MAG: hypothetical protein ACRD5H_17650, partial [Nitrososphaerales archaeon]